MIQPNSTILFQGDSITDAGRNREIAESNRPAALGSGYANLIASQLLQQRPEESLRFFNRGISGNRVTDLYARWRVDGINLQPDLISILIGVNDTWHEFMYGNGVEVDRYTTIYRMLLEYTKQRLPNVQLVLCEPFVLKCGVVTDGWIAEMDQRRQVVRKLATEFDAIFVPFQGMFDDALSQAGPDYWAADGVHPTPAGHRLLADTWLAAVV
ncbi:MAG: SGNH/GDSL hydrolase family protein [Caldilineaceae bacterium]|nr:SGNH/GDSL hydrolase family protein [Caldilineaceae bacterium]